MTFVSEPNLQILNDKRFLDYFLFLTCMPMSNVSSHPLIGKLSSLQSIGTNKDTLAVLKKLTVQRVSHLLNF